MSKAGLVKQVRSYKFIIVLTITVGIAYFCVPTSQDNYNIFIIGGMRGIYNSAYLGVLASAISAVLLFLVGFYLLRSQISEDRKLKIGQIIASRSISKQRYVLSKALANFLVLLLMETVFLFAIVAVQFIRGEDMRFVLMGYIWPLLEITLPCLFVLASLTVLFDTVAFLRGVFGNIVFFALWNVIIILPLELENKPMLDLFGLNRITSMLAQGAISANPGSAPDQFMNDVSFGLNIGTTKLPTFEWSGLSTDRQFVITRLIWIGIAVAIVLISSLVFDRFKKNALARTPSNKRRRRVLESESDALDTAITLSPISEIRNRNLLLLAKGELKIIRSELSYAQIGLITAGVILHMVFLNSGMGKWLCLFLAFLTSVWAGLGCRDNQYRTQMLVYCRCDMRDKWIASGIAGLVTAFTISIGAIVRYVLLGAWLSAVSWLVGIFFIVSLALTLGTLTGNRRLFEALFIIWLYLGPIQEVPLFNFLSNSAMTIAFYGLLGIALAVIGFSAVTMKEKRILE